jgi:predicted AlkP superfamily phosphohydrolase/phosphomutase
LRGVLEGALAPDLTYRRAGDLLREAYDPAFFATYVYGLDVVGHSFLRFAEPDRFGNVKPDDVRQYGRVLPTYRALVAEWIGEAAQAVGPGEVLLVVSGYGMEPMPLWRRIVGSLLGGSPPSGTHAAAPDGFLLAIGDGIKAGGVVENATVLDIAPTILYLAGLPVGRDMEGRVLTEILDDDFARAHPVSFIPSYESLAAPRAGDTAPLPPLGEEDEGP